MLRLGWKCELSATPYASALQPGNPAGRFHLSTAQHRDMEPSEAMLRAHTARMAVLPERYGNASKVTRVLDRLCRIFSVVQKAVPQIAVSSGSVWSEDLWAQYSP